MRTSLIETDYKKLYRNGLFQPESLDLTQLLPKKELKHADKYRYLLHTIYIARHQDRRNKATTPISINSQTFRNVVSERRAKPIINFLTQQGVIETSGKYQAGAFCKGYRFTAAYRNEKVKLIPFVDAKFEQSLDRKKMIAVTTPDLSQANMRFLHFNLKELQIDADGAYNYIADKFKYTRKHFDQHNAFISSVDAIVKNQYFFKRDSKGRRLHHNFATITKELRKFFYVESGEELVNIDVRNSQPLMLAVLLQQHQIKADQYTKDVESGLLYEKIAAAANITLTNTNRKAFKKRFFKDVLYGRNKNACQTPLFKAFTVLYPAVAEFVAYYKRKNHAELAITLQRIESEIILDGVIKELAADYKPEHYFALTIHDSVTVTRSNAADMINRMNNAFSKFNIKPELQIESL